MPIKIRIVREAESVANQGGEGGEDLPFAVGMRLKRADAPALPGLPFEVRETDPYVDFLIKKLNCVEVKNGTAWIPGGNSRKGNYYS